MFQYRNTQCSEQIIKKKSGSGVKLLIFTPRLPSWFIQPCVRGPGAKMSRGPLLNPIPPAPTCVLYSMYPDAYTLSSGSVHMAV